VAAPEQALEPEQPTTDERNPELDDMSRRLRVAALLSAPLLVVAMASMAPFHWQQKTACYGQAAADWRGIMKKNGWVSPLKIPFCPTIM